MANNNGSNAKTSCNQNLNSPGKQQFVECSSSFSQLSISQTGSESKVEAGTTFSSSLTGSALGQQVGVNTEQQKSPHINQYWAYSQLPSNQATSINQPAATSSSFINTSSTGSVFSRNQDNVSPPAKEGK